MVIDTEGHDMNVILGMNLEENYYKFPLFHFESADTWRDARAGTNFTHGDCVKYFSFVFILVFIINKH